MYSARISRNHPAAFIILIDQSGSMNETTLLNHQKISKADAVSLIVNGLIAELLHRCRREDGYRDYFEIAVLGYHGDEVTSLWSNKRRVFMRPSDLVGTELSQIRVQHERRLPDGQTVMSSVNQKVWVESFAGDKTPMYRALVECHQLCADWCGHKAHRDSYPPTIFNITDGESSDGGDRQLLEIAQSIQQLSTNDGCALLINIHLSSDITSMPVLFPESEEELPDQRYARLLYRMSSTMPAAYNETVSHLRGKEGTNFRGISYNAAMTDLVNMMNIGSVSVNLLF